MAVGYRQKMTFGSQPSARMAFGGRQSAVGEEGYDIITHLLKPITIPAKSRVKSGIIRIPFQWRCYEHHHTLS